MAKENVARKLMVGEKAYKKFMKIADSYLRKETVAISIALKTWFDKREDDFDFTEPDKYFEKGFYIEKEQYEKLQSIAQGRNEPVNRLFAKFIAEYNSWQK